MLKWILISLLVVVALGVAVLVFVEIVDEVQPDEVQPDEVPVVEVYVVYTNISCFGLKNCVIPKFGDNYELHHTYVLAQDPETKDGVVTRAGPEQGCDDDRRFGSNSQSRLDPPRSESSCPRFCKPTGQLSDEGLLWAYSFPGIDECEDKTLYKQHVGTVNRPLSDVADRMGHFVEANNKCNNREYESGAGLTCPTPYNSNSYSFSVVEELLMERRPEPVFGTTLPIPCKYDRAHGWDQVVNLKEC